LWGNRKRNVRTRARPPRPIRLLNWLVPALVTLALLAGGLFWFLRDHAVFHVTMVRVYGTERVPQQELIQLAQLTRDTSLLRINVERVRARIMQHPWIRDALVRRMYPNELEVIVYERRPAAVLESGAGHVLDVEGYLLGQATAADLASLPRLAPGTSPTPGSGVRITEPTVQAGLRLLSQIRDSAFFRNTTITRLDIMTPERFVVQTQRGKFIMGGDLTGIDEKLDLFPAVDDVLRGQTRRVEYIDISVENQIIVKTSARTTQASSRLEKRGGGSEQTH
jgi:cell division protein FtsQ